MFFFQYYYIQLLSGSLHDLVSFFLSSYLLLFLGTGVLVNVSCCDSQVTVAFAVTTRNSNAEKQVTYTLSMSLLFVGICALCTLCVWGKRLEPYKDVSDWEKCVWQRVIERERGWDAPLFFCVLGFCFVFFKHSLKDVHKQSPFPDRLKRELFLPQGLDYNKISMRIKVSGRLSSPHNHDTFRECILLKWGL